MNKSALIAVVVAILLAVGAGVFVLTNKTSKEPDSSKTQTGNTTQNSTATQKKSLKDLMGSGTNQECKFTDSTSGSEGLVQTSGKKVYGEFTTSSNGQTILSHMVSDGENTYVWIEGQSQGMKMSEKSLDDLSDAPEEQKGSVDLNEKVDYKCGSWAVDNSVFELPGNVEFQDLSAMMQELEEAMPKNDSSTGDAKAQQCESCNSLPDSAKIQCLQALGC